MICPRCKKHIVGRKKRCDRCGQDLRPYESFRKLSNKLYNEGLEMAQIRNLSGAVDKLKKSLEFDKENIEARNLLGLVYYELGETVAAVVQWVISSNIQTGGNEAEDFLKKVQGDANEFQEATTAIKKYNSALEMVQKGKEDLAMIQLKTVISINPHYVNALLLRALLYINHGHYENAKRDIKAALRIDVGNVTARRYMNEIRDTLERQGKILKKTENLSVTDDSLNTRRLKYKEDKPNFVAIVVFFIGLVIGLVSMYFFAVPSIRKQMNEQNAEETRRNGENVSTLQGQISTLSKENDTLSARISELESSLNRAENDLQKAEEKLNEMAAPTSGN